jgi:hypothetical protein
VSTDIEPSIHLVLRIASVLQDVMEGEGIVTEEAAMVLNTFSFCNELVS